MAIVGLLNPGRKTKSMTFRMFSSTWIGRSRMKLGEYGTSLFHTIKGSMAVQSFRTHLDCDWSCSITSSSA